MVKYNHVRFRWWNPVDLDKAKEELKDFKASVKQLPTGQGIDLYKDDKRELTATADTLMAHLGGFRAVLSQREEKPFTKRDAELREKVRELYPQDRPTPFPWEWSPEPRFTVEE
jgi:hypothetical protein